MFRTDTKVLGSDENEWIEEGSDVENNGLHFSQLFIANQFSNFISACQSMHATSVFAKTHPLQAGHTSIPFYLYYHKLLIDF
ncbi:hypothetical protein GC194_11710 [bacterium]|nr:hypothetical protein [bacterium]